MTPPEAGIARALAIARSSRISDLRYAVHLSIPLDRVVSIRGAIVVSFDLASVAEPLVLDFAPAATGELHSLTVNDVPADAPHENGHVIVPNDALRVGRNALRLDFTADDGPLNRRDDHLYTIFVPARAHEAMPCFDQPDLKARWSLTLETPAEWQAVANAREVSRRPAHERDGHARTIWTFAETQPIPTYLFAFAVGRFVEERIDRPDRPMRLYHCGVDADLVASNLDTIADGHVAALSWMEQYTGVPYAFDSFDIVLLPAFQFGGMEHPGAIFYNAAALLLSSSATRQQLLARAHVVAHETAHMWFGDLVTMTWFDDVWMKEVFANFMAAKIVNPEFSDLEHELRFLHGHYPGAYDVDRTRGAHPIRQRLDNLEDAGSLYGAIIYLKSPIVMRQLELLLGEHGLRDALREYLARFSFGNASWSDLLTILSTHTALDIAAWSRGWIDQAGRPVVHTRLDIEDGAVSRLELRQIESDACDASGIAFPGLWPQRVHVALGYGARVEHVEGWLERQVELSAVLHRPAPDYVLPNGRGLGYGEFRLDSRSRAWLVAHLPEIGDALTRGSAWITLWDAMLIGDLAPGHLLDLAVRALERESSELNLQRVLGYVERLFWIFHSPTQRDSVADRLEQSLRSAIDRGSTPTMKAACFACFRCVASTVDAVAWLERLWHGEARIDGLLLGDVDRVALVQELAVRRSDGDTLVHQQIARTGARDRRDALAFVAPALSSDPRERDRFFATVSQATNRRREPWVIDGMRWLHHPLRAQRALHYLAPGLALLEELKHTGDIFLPKRWLDAMLGGHRSVSAADVVHQFLDTRPATYPPALTRMVLASADHLFRAATHAS